MGVNSVFTDFFTGRRMAAYGLAISTAIGMFAIFSISSAFTKRSDRDIQAKQVNILIRQIGHRLLLQAGDSTSRVLPVAEVKTGTFLLEFEKEFVFNHDSLMVLTNTLLPKTQFPSGYTVTVHDCMHTGIVYGFQVNNTTPDILPCQGRSQPVGCYRVEFTFPDFYESVKQNNSEADPMAKEIRPVKVDAQGKTEKEMATTLDHDIDLLAEQLKSFKADTPEADSKFEPLNTSTVDYPLSNLVYSGILVLVIATLFIARFGNFVPPGPAQFQKQEITNEPIPGFPAVGKFLFDIKGQRLLLGSEVVMLTDKECKILELFNKNFGELIARETLMQEIWINEGVITGRSLDMFVSKLRKKLSSDPGLKITNIHGKGYKLATPGINIL